MDSRRATPQPTFDQLFARCVDEGNVDALADVFDRALVPFTV